MTKLRACIVAVGSEMLTPVRVDTNSLTVTERLNAIGYDVRLKVVVADQIDELAQVLEAALTWAELIVITGGLGPTDDDMTRAALANVLQTPLEIHEDVVDRIRERFARRGMKMPDRNNSGRIVAFTMGGAASAFGIAGVSASAMAANDNEPTTKVTMNSRDGRPLGRSVP